SATSTPPERPPSRRTDAPRSARRRTTSGAPKAHVPARRTGALRCAAMPGRVEVHIEAPIGWLVIDHRERRNAVSLAMWQAIPELAARLDADPAVRVVVLRGAGEEAFVSGADISEFAR